MKTPCNGAVTVVTGSLVFLTCSQQSSAMVALCCLLEA